MGTKFLALVLSLCLVLSSFYEVSCQDEGSGSLSTLDLIEHEYQTSVNSLQGNEVDQTETSGQKNSTSNNTISLSLSEEPVETVKESVDTSAELGAVTDEADKPSSMLDHIELEFEAHVNELKEAGSDGINKFDESKEDEEAARRHKMLEAIEREFEAAHAGFEQLKTDDSTQGLDDEQSAKRQSMLDEIERDFEAATKGLEQLKADDITGVNDEEHAAKRQKMLEEIEREFEEATKGLEELRHSTSSTDDEAHSAKRQSMLDEIEREFEAATSGLKELKINAFTIKDDVADKEQDAKRQSMLDAIEREFEAVTESFKQLEDIADNKDEGDDQSAKRQSMLDEIEREFEAATNSLKQLNLDDFTEGDDNEQSAKRHSMLEAIEREFEAATRGLEELKNESEHAENNRKSMLEAIEREFEAATNAKTNGEDSAKNPSTISTVQKTSGGYNAGLEGLLKPADGVCGCFNKDKDGLQADTDSSINIAEILAEESKLQGSGTSPLTTSLNNLVDTHRKETSSKVGSVLGSSSSVTSTTSESAATSESIESLKQTLRKLRGLSARDLVNHPNFDAIIAAGTRYEVLSSASIGYISLLAKYKTVIKEGLEASQRVQIAQTRAKLLKETAMEKQRTVDSVFAAAKTTAQRGDALHIRIVAIKKLLAKLEAEKVNVDSKFTSLTTNLSELLKEASQAYEEYHEAVHKAKDEQAAEEFAVETTKRAEHIWVEFLSSLN
ncbi:TSA1-like protein isoform X2 [Arabidopsis lyrata subsp. lyrata]|uniref:TSA1-like protein isoform X2 n=1 Tax=Arabidopsis lyrata subsp. lyrata TaxID=81972 RepID=UPI000A29C642|nr:TSA1-like protein isoform X2 [Arabidopsis lyrata subsp. lyrata]|eukprot:XP_020889491.1 TSA1-like protein isoform X2 [Arabidopsis lyrata subsp. lyrata]